MAVALATAVAGPSTYQSLPARDIAGERALALRQEFQGMAGEQAMQLASPPQPSQTRAGPLGPESESPPPAVTDGRSVPTEGEGKQNPPAGNEAGRLGGAAEGASPAQVDTPELPLALGRVSGLRRVTQLTGPGSLNATDLRWNVHGTDLGHMFLHRGELYMVFGDTFGPLQRDWRSNTMARIASPDPRDGLRFESMISDSSGAAAELLPSLKFDGAEMTVIPTYGVSVGDRMILHYMSVRQWGSPGHWDLNYSGLAHSDDDGRSWVKHPRARWAKDSNFGQVAFVSRDGMIYLFGIPGGRFGGVRLARVAAADILRLGAYEYWDGSRWIRDEASAALVLPGPVGELSVRWSAHHGLWLMMYLNEDTDGIALRTARRLTGPWSEEQVVTTAKEYPQLYAPYLVPGADTGPDVYFTMSQYGTYQVYLMRMTLR